MERRDALKVIAAGTTGAVMAGSFSLELEAAEKSCTKGAVNVKKYPNSHYYKDGKFLLDVAYDAFFEMFEAFHYTLTDSLRSKVKNGEFWVTDFGLGDFANVGMGGIFWVNDKEFRYFAHEIYLLPGQMIPEHYHLAAEDRPAKHESWHVRYGSINNFGIGGEKTPETLAMLPKSQLDANAITCFNWKHLETGAFARLTGIGDPHFMQGGPEGAIVSEYANYHSQQGLNFTNKKAKA